MEANNSILYLKNIIGSLSDVGKRDRQIFTSYRGPKGHNKFS